MQIIFDKFLISSLNKVLENLLFSIQKSSKYSLSKSHSKQSKTVNLNIKSFRSWQAWTRLEIDSFQSGKRPVH